MSFQFSPKIITDGLVLYLDVANSRSYSGSGTIWNDLGKFGNNGTLTNFGSQTIFDSNNGGSIVLDGTNDFIKIPYVGNTSNGYTFNIVMKCNNMTSDTNLRETLFGLSYNDNFAYLQFTLEIWGNVGVGFRGDGLDAVDYSWSSGGDANSINFYTVTMNSTGHSIYVNGVFKNTLNRPYTSDFNSIILGARYEGNFWNGKCYLFQMYNRILSPTEVLQNYNTMKSRYNL